MLEDIHTLARMRFEGPVRYSDEQAPGAGGGKRPGADLFAHLGACQLAMIMPARVLWYEIQAWSRILPADYATSADLIRHTSTLLDRARRAAAGETVGHRGRELSPVWTYNKDRLIELLQIDRGEMPHMTRLIDREEKRRRDTEATRAARRANGVGERTLYEAKASVRRAQVLSSRAQGLSRRAIGLQLGISEGEARRLARTAQKGA